MRTEEQEPPSAPVEKVWSPLLSIGEKMIHEGRRFDIARKIDDFTLIDMKWKITISIFVYLLPQPNSTST